ncbi:hypothetical protein [Peterkaempfera bronchialis]|uniref:hypothetical protein n=1 Tax=Peterkaempfera bronchialis TaxID=2126346 RepID=UPI003C3035F6
MPHMPAAVLHRVRDEIDVLRTGAAPVPGSFVRLRGLGPRLTALLAELTAAGVPAARLTPLWAAAELLQPLTDGVDPTPAEAQALAEQTADLLATFATAEHRPPDDT